MLPRLTLALGLVLSGCSASTLGSGDYDADANLTRYQSAPVPLGRATQGTYASGVRLILRASGECVGEGCTPASYVISVSNTGATEVASDFNQVIFATPDGSISFDAGRDAEGADNSTVFFNSGRGELVRLLIPSDIFASFATSPTLSVKLGAQEYAVPYESRASLRRMLEGTAEA